MKDALHVIINNLSDKYGDFEAGYVLAVSFNGYDSFIRDCSEEVINQANHAIIFVDRNDEKRTIDIGNAFHFDEYNELYITDEVH
jgi:hypothetical protein